MRKDLPSCQPIYAHACLHHHRRAVAQPAVQLAHTDTGFHILLHAYVLCLYVQGTLKLTIYPHSADCCWRVGCMAVAAAAAAAAAPNVQMQSDTLTALCRSICDEKARYMSSAMLAVKVCGSSLLHNQAAPAAVCNCCIVLAVVKVQHETCSNQRLTLGACILCCCQFQLQDSYTTAGFTAAVQAGSPALRSAAGSWHVFLTPLQYGCRSRLGKEGCLAAQT